ncbi:hypothetical protein F5Y19DRAFT_484743 [Xylariaceae sp. FL1651]|nr:hypothetical protein F5Y19DRAFT_484743 [Xylariaceae sp. FL1651]
MCKSTGWMGEISRKPVLSFTEIEWEERCQMRNNGMLTECFSDVSLDTSLLLPSRSGLGHVPQHCENAPKAKMLDLRSFSAIRNPQKWIQYTAKPGWLRPTPRFREYPKCSGQEILAYIFIKSKVPRCGWPALEALATTILACWLPNTVYLILFVLLEVIPEGGRRTLRDTFEVDKDGLWGTVFDTEQLPRVACLSVDGNWSDQLGIWGRPTQGLHELEGLFFRLSPYYDLAAFQATKECRSSGPCPNRLWNVSMLGAGGVADLPSIVSIALRNSIGVGDTENPHLDCTEQSCLFSYKNSTLVPQHHICAAGNCGPVAVFPKEILNVAFSFPGAVAGGRSNRRPWAPSAWRTAVDGPSLCTIGQEYLAISHIWADGTGKRSKDSGEVNTCLINYFSDVAKRLNCSGIWWDAISVPTSSLRTAAIDNMLMNYENAAYTLVHDRELLWASRRYPVKVLFKDPDKAKTKPLIKDLDKDILAWNPKSMNSIDLNDLEALDAFGRARENLLFNQNDLVPSYGHFVATDILRRLRDGGISGLTTTLNLRDLLLNLRARVTAWVKDWFVIPGLIDLYHGQVPATLNGPWSWCPPSIFDLGESHNSLSRRPATIHYRKNDVVVPFDRHPAVGAQTSAALRDRQRCLLLTDKNDRDQSQRQFILACPVWVGWVAKKLAINCQWAGGVYLGTPDVINPRESRKVSIERGLEPVEDLGDFNMRRHIKGSGFLRFLFEANTDENHQPLPLMRPDTILSALSSFKRATGKLQWERRPQPVCVYPPNTSERLAANEWDTHSSFSAIIDESRDYNAIKPSLLPKLIGKVDLAWSFPHAPVLDRPILRRIFRSPFHVRKTLPRRVEIEIGWMTYSKHIGPRCTRAQGRGAEKDKGAQILVSSIQENSPDILDWNKPIRELEACERGPKRRSLTGTFDFMLKDTPLYHKLNHE